MYKIGYKIKKDIYKKTYNKEGKYFERTTRKRSSFYFFDYGLWILICDMNLIH